MDWYVSLIVNVDDLYHIIVVVCRQYGSHKLLALKVKYLGTPKYGVD